MALQGPSTSWNSLPCESLALIAAQLDPPDRQCLATACSSGHRAVAMSTYTLSLPGSHLLQGDAIDGHFTTPDGCCCHSCDWACTPGCVMPGQLASSHASLPGLDSSSSSSLQPAALCCNSSMPGTMTTSEGSRWLQHYTGVRRLHITSCDSCQLQAAQPGDASLYTHPPGSPHTPTFSSELTTSSSCCRSTLGPGLAGFLAAVGGNMPYLQQLDLSSACPCLYTSPGVLDTIAAACPRLVLLSIPTWLLHSAVPGSSKASSTADTSSPDSASSAGVPAAVLSDLLSMNLQRRNSHLLLQHQDEHGAAATKALSGAADVTVARHGFRLSPLDVHEGQQQQLQLQACSEQLSSLAALRRLTCLQLSGCAPPAAALEQLATLTTLHSFSLHVTSSSPLAPVGFAALPGWHEDNGSHSSSSSSDSSSPLSTDNLSMGTCLGNSLAKLTGLTNLVLYGVVHVPKVLKALSGLPNLAVLEVANLPDFAVSSLASLSGLVSITQLRVQGCKALQVTARSALPLQLQALQSLAVLELDFDLHLRDMQVLCLLKRLSHLTVNSFHHCIHLMPNLSLPALRGLRISSLSHFALQQQQQHGLIANLQVAQALAAPAAPGAAAMAGVAPGAAAAAAVPAAAGQPLVAVAAGGPPIIPLAALPVLGNLQQQQAEHPAYVLMEGNAGQALLLQHPGLRLQQNEGPAPVPVQLHSAAPAAAAGASASATIGYGLQAAGDGGGPQLALLPQQQPAGLVNGIGLQLLQLRQQQLYLQQQQLRLQQQQVRLQLQQMQAQLLQQAQPPGQQAAGQNILALPSGVQGVVQGGQQQQQQQQVQQTGVLPQQQGQFGPPLVAAAAAAQPAAGNAGWTCARTSGWLTVLFPGLAELQVTSCSSDIAPVLLSLQGHQNLHKLVIGNNSKERLQVHQRGRLEHLGTASNVLGLSAAAAAAPAGTVGCCAGRQASAAAGGSGVVPWGVLRSLPCLEVVELHDAAAILQGQPGGLGAALSGQLVRLVLRNANNLSDIAALLGPYSWSNLEHLEVEGAQELAGSGLSSISSLPALTSLRFNNCPNIDAPGLASCLLSSSRSLKLASLLCCAGVTPAEARAMQDALWSVCHRRMMVCWSRYDPDEP